MDAPLKQKVESHHQKSHPQLHLLRSQQMASEPNGVNPKQPSMVQGITVAVRYYTNRCRVQRTSKLVQKQKQHSEFSSNLELNSISFQHI